MGRPTDSSGPKKPCIRGGSRSHRKGQSYGLSPVVSNPDGHKSGRSYGSVCVVAMRPFGRLLWSLIFRYRTNAERRIINQRFVTVG